MKSGLRRLLNQGSPPVPYAPRSYQRSAFLNAHSGNEQYLKATGANGTLWQIVHRLSSDSARPEWRLYRKTQDKRVRYSTTETGSDQRTEVLQHQALSVLQHPSPFGQTRSGSSMSAFSRFSLFELSGQYLELTGESPWVVARDSRASFPMGLWPVRPDRLEAVPSAETFLKGWIYTGPDGEQVPLAPDELIMEKYPNPWDPYRGLGPVQSILVDLEAAQYSARWNLSFFLNSATPGGVIEVDHAVDDDEWDRLETRWREAHQGVSRAHRVAMLEGGQKWVPNSMSLKDMDFANLRGVSRDIIREAFAMHKAMMGQSDDVNRANAQTALEVYQGTLVTERLGRRRDTLNEQFLPLFGSTGSNVEFDYISPVAPNREADVAELTGKSNSANILVAAGYDPHDVLEVVGLPDMGFTEKPPPPPPALPAAPDAGAGEQAAESQGGGDSGDVTARLAKVLANGHMPVGSLR
jgi:HK97 family phage portal protein